MNLCKTCGTICPFDDERTECDAYAPMTNENWFCSLSTNEKAKWLEEKMTWAAQEQGTFTAKGWEIWLKQPYTNKEQRNERSFIRNRSAKNI